MKLGKATLCLDSSGITREVLLDDISLGRNVRSATVRCEAQTFTILTVEFIVDEVVTERVASGHVPPERA